MLLPRPDPGESKVKYVDRFMADKSVIEEYETDEKRKAISHSLWGHSKRRTFNEMERRVFPLMELRIDDKENSAPIIVGHAAVFDKWSEPMWGMREIIRKGAFKKTIKEAEVRALFNHDPNYILGNSKNKKEQTLFMEEDKRGLAYEAHPPQTQIIDELVLEPIRRGDIHHNSFGFRSVVDKEVWGQNKKGEVTRELLEVKLFDISMVVFPAYPQTDVKVRSIFDDKGIEYESLNGAMEKCDQGFDLDEADHKILQSAIDLLQGYIPGEPDQGIHSDGDGEPDQKIHSQIRTLEIRERMTRIKEFL